MKQTFKLKKKGPGQIRKGQVTETRNPLPQPQTDKEIEELSDDFARIEQALNKAQESGVISQSREEAERFVEVEFNQTVGE